MREASRQRVFFDNIERTATGFAVEAFTVRPVKNSDCYAHQGLGRGVGDTPATAVLDALTQTGVVVDGAAEMLFRAEPATEDFDAMIGGGVSAATVTADDDFEGMLG